MHFKIQKANSQFNRTGGTSGFILNSACMQTQRTHLIYPWSPLTNLSLNSVRYEHVDIDSAAVTKVRRESSLFNPCKGTSAQTDAGVIFLIPELFTMNQNKKKKSQRGINIK